MGDPPEEATTIKFKNPFRTWQEMTDSGSPTTKCVKSPKVSKAMERMMRGRSSTAWNEYDHSSTQVVYRPDQTVPGTQQFNELICSVNGSSLANSTSASSSTSFELHGKRLHHILVTSPAIFLGFLGLCGAVIFCCKQRQSTHPIKQSELNGEDYVDEDNMAMVNMEKVVVLPTLPQQPEKSSGDSMNNGSASLAAVAEDKAPFQAAVRKLIAIFMYQLQRRGSTASDGIAEVGSPGNAEEGGVEAGLEGVAYAAVLNTIQEEANMECEMNANFKEELYKDKVIWQEEEQEQQPGNSEV